MLGKSSLQLAIRWAGYILVFTSIAYVCLVISNQLGEEVLLGIQTLGILPFASAIACFLLSSFLGSYAWASIMRGLGSTTRAKTLSDIFLLSVAAKHIPGNVSHFLGRAGLVAKRQGETVRRVTTSFLWEALLLTSLGTALALLSFGAQVLTFLDEYSRQSLENWSLIAVGVIIVIFGAGFALKNKGWSFFSLLAECRIDFLSLVTASLLYLCCFVILGYATQMTMGDSGISLWNSTSLFALAFVSGFVVPGAPGGLGVREAVFIYFLPPDIQIEGTAAIIIMRVAQLISDALASPIGWLLVRRSNSL